MPVRFVQIGSAGGAEIAMPATVLRFSSIEMRVSGLGSAGLPRLIAALTAPFILASQQVSC